MKSNIEKVYSKLPKTELSEVELTKVELGLVDDIVKENIRIINIYDGAVNDYKDAADLLQRVASLYSKNLQKVNEAIKKAKELGVPDVEKKLNKAKSISEKYEKEAKEKAKKIFSL